MTFFVSNKINYFFYLPFRKKTRNEMGDVLKNEVENLEIGIDQDGCNAKLSFARR